VHVQEVLALWKCAATYELSSSAKQGMPLTPITCLAWRPQEVLSSMRVALGTSETKFSAALNPERRVSVTGEVKAGAPYLTQIGSFDVELGMEGIILLVRPPKAHHQLGSLPQ